MADQRHAEDVRVSNWTLATRTRPGARLPIVVAGRTGE